MEAWVTLKEAIPDGQVRAIAARMNVSYDYVLRWRREPTSDETPSATGRAASPLGRVCNLVDAVFLTNPLGASLIVEHVVLHHEQLVNAQRVESFGDSIEQRALASGDILTQATQAIVSLNQGVTEETLRKLILLREVTNQAIARVGKDLYQPQPTNRRSSIR